MTYVWLSTFGYVQPRPEYKEEELKRAVDIMFTQVLRARDGKTRGMKKLKLINGLTQGMSSEAVVCICICIYIYVCVYIYMYIYIYVVV